MGKTVQYAKDKINKVAETGKTVFRTESFKQDFESGKSILEGIKKIKEINEASEGEDLDSISYPQMLDIWGIREHQVHYVIKNLKAEMMMYLSMVLLTFVALLFSHGHWAYVVSFFLVMPMMCGICLMRYWRVQCLEKRRFVPFKAWVKTCYKA